MKCFISTIPVMMCFFIFNSCSNQTQPTVNNDSLSNNLRDRSLAGKLYFFAPEFDSTSLVATGTCDCCSANIVFLDDSCFLSIDYCEEGCSYMRGNYQFINQELTLNFDTVTVEKIYPERDSLGESPADFVYNTTIQRPTKRSYKENKYKGRIIFSNSNEFGAIDTGGSTPGMMNSVRAQGICDRLNADPKLIGQQAAEEVNDNLLGSWSLPGERNASFQILEKTIYFLDQPKKIRLQNSERQFEN